MTASQSMLLRRETSTINDRLRMVNETQMRCRRKRRSAAAKSGHASSWCQRSAIARRSSAEPPRPFSSNTSPSTSRCTLSMLNSGSTVPVIRRSERRRCSFASACQSRSIPCAMPHAAIAAVKPACQSSTVPPVSKARTLICFMLSSAGTHPCGRHHEVADDQPQTLVFMRLQHLAQNVERRPGRGLVPEPVGELAARRLRGSGAGRFQTIRLQIVDCEAQEQRRREPVAGARRRLAAQPIRDIAGTVADCEPAQPHRAAAMLLDPTPMRALEQQDFGLQPGRERLCRAVRDRGRYERRLPSRIGAGARIVIRKTDDTYRPTVLDQYAERSQNHPPLKCRVVRRAKRPPQLKRYPQRAWRLRPFGLWPDQHDGDGRDTLCLEIMA